MISFLHRHGRNNHITVIPRIKERGWARADRMKYCSLNKMTQLISNISLGNVSSYWDDEGCRVVGTSNGSVTCACDHFTNFALLLNVAGRPPNPKQAEILSYISQIGCGISLVGLVLTIFAHASVR